jgi:hypothetical protein
VKAGIRLTARGAIALVFVVTFVGHVTASSSLWGAAFVAGCLAAVLLVRPRELLSLVVTPPLVFFVATLLSELIRSAASGSFVQALGLGMFTSLSAGAPWLFAGSALMLALAWARGLPSNVRALRDELRATRASAPQPRAAGAAPFAPEPEGYFEPRTYGSPRDDK